LGDLLSDGFNFNRVAILRSVELNTVTTVLTVINSGDLIVSILHSSPFPRILKAINKEGVGCLDLESTKLRISIVYLSFDCELREDSLTILIPEVKVKVEGS
jgi:hypothetical protein